MRVRAPRSTSSASGVCASAAASSAARQPPVLLPRRLHQPPRVARVRAAGRVHQQAEQALRLGPALHGVLLVHLARVLGEPPQPRGRLVAAPDRALGQRLQQHLHALAALVARPAADDVDRLVERLGVAHRRRSPGARARAAASCGCAAGTVITNRRRSSPVESKCSIAFARRQLFDATRAPASAAHTCCSCQERCSTAIRHSSRSKTCCAPLRCRR